MARVNALNKKGPRYMLDNYRPISILPVVSKVFERILYKQLVQYLDAENLLLEHQFGFRCSHSTVGLTCSNAWYCNMDRGLYSQFVNRVDGIFHFQPVSSSQVYKLLNSLSVCKASGIDKISAKVLK